MYNARMTGFKSTPYTNWIRGVFSKVKNVSSSAFQSYIVDRYSTNKIQNDMGASFTSIKRQRDRIIKHAAKKGEEKLKNEIEWILAFRGKNFGKHLPLIYDYSLDDGNIYYEMKYYPYPNLRKIIIEDLNTRFVIEDRWKMILKLMFTKFYIHSHGKESTPDFFLKHHYNKYRIRIEQACQAVPEFSEIVNADYLYINSVIKIGPEKILNELKNHKSILQSLTPPRVYISHGDLHSNNIICGLTSGRFILLDSRGKSPAGDLYFDPSYDIAKIYHDLHSQYSLIENHGFNIDLSNKEGDIHLDYAFTDNFLVEKFTRYYFFVRSYISGKYQKGEFELLNYRADFTEAMLYLTMIPLHLKTSDEGLICLATGIVRLNQWLKRYHFDIYKKLLGHNL